MGWVNYKSARIFMIISSIILGLYGIVLIIIDLLFALDKNLNLANSLHSYYVVMWVGWWGGGIWIISGFLFGIILGWVKKKTDWIKCLIALFILFIWIWCGGIWYYIYWFIIFLLNPYGLCIEG